MIAIDVSRRGSSLARRPRLLLLLTVISCTGRPAEPVLPADLPWQPFYWARVGGDSARFDQAAMLVELPLRRGTAPSLVQLDLAASGMMPEGFPPAGGNRGSTVLRRTGQLYGLLAGMDKVFMSPR